MRYYLYISDSKIDMLFGQIPQRLRRRLAAELTIDLKLVSATLAPSRTDETRYSKTDLVVHYLERHAEVGSVDYPQQYFRGTLPMRWGQATPRMVYFGGETARTVFGLGGSMRHVLGAREANGATSPDASVPDSKIETGYYYGPGSGAPEIVSALDQLVAAVDEKSPLSKMGSTERAIVITTQKMSGHKYALEFLAKRLISSSMDYRRRQEIARNFAGSNEFMLPQHVLLGTPIYVAQAD